MAVPTLPILCTPPREFFLFFDYIPLFALSFLLVALQIYLLVTVLMRFRGEDQAKRWLNYI